jgi:hypothetical protein
MRIDVFRSPQYDEANHDITEEAEGPSSPTSDVRLGAASGPTAPEWCLVRSLCRERRGNVPGAREEVATDSCQMQTGGTMCARI